VTQAKTPTKLTGAENLPSYSGLSGAILGRDRAMRANIKHTLLSFSIYVIWMIVEAICASQGLISWRDVASMYSFNLFGVTLFFALMRSGLSNRLNDPGMVLAQSFYATGALMLAYVFIPVTRAAALQTLCMSVVFGMFTMRPREIVIACAWMISMLLATATLLLWIRPPQFDVTQEIVNVSVACIVLPALTLITRHFALLREKLNAQRIELKSALGRVQELATRDTLTNLANRAHMQEILNQEVARHQRLGAVFSLALLDIDHFKSINDNHGHQTGDEVLVGFARWAETIQRQSDIIARWGGEEFLILMPQTPCEAAQIALERFRAGVAKAHLSTTVDNLIVTVSIGVTQWRTDESVKQAIERADRALYAAKEGGRNRIVLAR